MKDLQVNLAQLDLVWENKEANFLKIEQLLTNKNIEGSVLILPEMFSTGFSMQPAPLAETMQGKTVEWLSQLSASKKAIVTGSFICQENSSFYNRLIWMLPNGQYACYDKNHLFSYAGEHNNYTAGKQRLIVSVNGWRLNLQVCYDLRFPVWVRQQVSNNMPEYDAIVYVANWPEVRNSHWQSLLVARAIENQCYVIAVNRVGNDANNNYHCGNSMIVNPYGEIIFNSLHKEQLYSTQLSASYLLENREKYKFLNDANKFTIMY